MSLHCRRASGLRRVGGDLSETVADTIQNRVLLLLVRGFDEA